MIRPLVKAFLVDCSTNKAQNRKNVILTLLILVALQAHKAARLVFIVVNHSKNVILVGYQLKKHDPVLCCKINSLLLGRYCH